jgi:hypothetical protein
MLHTKAYTSIKLSDLSELVGDTSRLAAFRGKSDKQTG